MHVRPLRDWLVVKLDPIPGETLSGIILPGGTSGQERQRTGTVLRVGPGTLHWFDTQQQEVRRPVGVQPGARIVFFRENLEHQQGKALSRVLHDLEDDVGMIRANDILYVMEDA